jgi:hypothetical protein
MSRHPTGPTPRIPRERTIADARAYMIKLPDGREHRQTWQHAARLILDQADVRDVSRQIELAPFKDAKLDLEALNA